ncbi:MAG: peptide deformylase [Thermoleophilia bacterium]|nr:peptide deformylase [Thermoleophilia bacterium]
MAKKEKYLETNLKQFGDPILREKSKNIEHSNDLYETVQKMTKIVKDLNASGLAAPQIGILRRIIVFRFERKTHVLINPEITWKSEDMIEGPEGCLSLSGIWTMVNRFSKIVVQGRNLDGDLIKLELEGENARIIQHEIDHLDGITIYNRVPKEYRKEILYKLGKIG